MSINLLIEAVKEKETQIIELLLKKVDVNSKGKNGCTPLHWAADFGHTEVAELLITAGAEVNATVTEGPWKGYTPLHFAVSERSLETVKVLIEAGTELI